jgi:large subunit ribosomal protein L19
MQNELIQLVQNSYLRSDHPNFGAGATVNVHVRIKEGVKERIQVFKGVVIQRRGTGATETVTVRKESNGVGVERIFPLHSPAIDRIEVLKHGRVRRARIFYMRDRSGKSARIREDLRVTEKMNRNA